MYINQKYKIEVAEDFQLPKIKYKGKSVEFQRVKGKKTPKIQTLDSNTSSKEYRDANDILKDTGSVVAQRPEWTFYLKYDDGRTEEFDGLPEHLERITHFTYHFKMPILVTGKNVILELSEDEIHLKNGKIYEITLKPFIDIDAHSGTAKFDVKSRTLIFDVDRLVKAPINEEPVEINQPKVVNTVDLDNDMLYDLV